MSYLSKIYQSFDEFEDKLTSLRANGSRLVFTNGTFDILHPGHVDYLHKARELGDVLIIGVNSDTSVRKYKSPLRPINTLEDRMAVLAGLGCVDYLIPFEETTPISLIRQLQPDIYVKGGDYTIETLPETPVVRSYGGKVKIIPFISGKSTTGIIEKITSIYTDQVQP